jgi:hypothetical protein
MSKILVALFLGTLISSQTCPNNQYFNSAQLSCQACPNNQVSSETSQCSCPSGSFFDSPSQIGFQSECTQCDPNFAVRSDNYTCLPCDEQTATSCQCPTGHAFTDLEQDGSYKTEYQVKLSYLVS